MSDEVFFGLLACAAIAGIIVGTLFVYSDDYVSETSPYHQPWVMGMLILTFSIASTFVFWFWVSALIAVVGTFFCGYGTALFFFQMREKLNDEMNPPDPIPEPLPPPQPVEPPKPTFNPDRFAHTFILGASGSGKTSLMGELIAADIKTPCSVIVFDSQGDVISKIRDSDIPRSRVAIIDPTDIEYPVALGLFDFPATGVTAFERERNQNSVIELLTFVLNSLLDSRLTSKQDVVLRFVIRLCLAIPDATIHTLRDILSKGTANYTDHVITLSPSAQAFFRDEYHGRQFADTKEQLIRRIYGILENQTLDRMFSAPKSKLNMQQLIDDGSVILVNSAKSFLKEEGSAFFSRFMVALISQAIQNRDPRQNNMPTYFYIDEAAPIIDTNIANILETARKYKLGLTLAFQSLGQIPPDLQHVVITNTETKYTGIISAKDARALAPDMRSHPDTLLNVPKLSFLRYAPNWNTDIITITPGSLDRLPKRTDLRELIKENRERFSSTGIYVPLPANPQVDIEEWNKAR